MRNRFIGVFTALFVMLAVLVGAPAATGTQQAQAGECTLPGLCGKVDVYGGNALWVLATWPNNGTGQLVYPGRSSTYKDTDGFRVANGWCANVRLGSRITSEFLYTVGQGYHKLTDNWNRYQIETWNC